MMRMVLGRATLAALLVLTLTVAEGCGGSGMPLQRGVSLPLFRGQLATWSPTSRILAVPDQHGIELIDARGGPERLIPTPPLIDAFGRSTESRPVWSKDGRRLYFLSLRGTGAGHGAWACSVRVDGSGLSQVPLGVPVAGATWAPGGWPLIFIPNSLTRTSTGRLGPTPDLWRLDGPHARPRRVLAEPGEESEPAFSPDGKTILFRRTLGQTTGLWVVSAEGSRPKLLAGGRIDVLGASWSPNGRLIALTASTARSGRKTHLYVVSTHGGPLRDVSREEVLGGRPAWSPGGRWITFSNYDGAIRRARPDGTSIQTMATLPGEEVRGLLWSPNGRRLAYTARPFPREG